MDFKNLFVVYATVMVGYFILVKFIQRRKKHSADLSSSTIFQKAKKKHRANSILLRRAYTRLNNFALTHNFTRSLVTIFEPYNPGDFNATKSLVAATETAIGVVILVIFIVALLISPSPYIMSCCVILAYVVSREIVSNITKRINKNILKELDAFIELLQFNYSQTKMVDEAIRDSITGKNKTVEKHARKILSILGSEDVITELERYMNAVRNPYLRELLCICVVIHLYGDSQDDELDAFSASLGNLEKRVSDEFLRLDELQFAFRGKILGVLPPIIVGEVLRVWLAKSITEVEPYLNGFYGFIASILNIVIVTVSYLIMARLASDGTPDTSEHTLLTRLSDMPFVNRILLRYYTKNYGKYQQVTRTLKQLGSKLTVYTLTARRIVFAVIAFIATLILIIFYSISLRYRIVNSITGTGSKSTGATERTSIEIMMLSRAYTDKYLEEDILGLYRAAGGNAFYLTSDVKSFLKEQVITEMKTQEIEISNEQAFEAIYQYNVEHSSGTQLYTKYLGTSISDSNNEDPMYEMGLEQLQEIVSEASLPDALGMDIYYDSLGDDISSAVFNYQNAYFHWYWLILAFAIAFIAFQVPVTWLKAGKHVSQQLMESEVMQFQSLFVIMQLLSNISESDVMDWMLRFSVVFRESLHKCIIDYPMENNAAIEKLIDTETFGPFQTLMRKIQMCDKVGVHKAFADMSIVQENYVKQVAQSRNHRLRSAISNSELVLLLPWVAMQALYLVIPLLLEAFGEFSNMAATLSGL